MGLSRFTITRGRPTNQIVRQKINILKDKNKHVASMTSLGHLWTK